MENLLKRDYSKIIEKLPSLHISGSAFFDPDMTYLSLLQDVFMLCALICYNWCLDCTPRGLAPRNQGISDWTLFLYALAYTVRLAELNPFQHMYYDVAVCLAFAILFWISMGKSIYYNSKVPAILDSPETHRIIGRRPLFIHATVAATALLAYCFNYDHLKLTGKLFCFAWSHYLEAVAMVPQYIVIFTMMRKGDLLFVATEVWAVIALMAGGRIFQLANWTYLWDVSQLMDKLAVISAFVHLGLLFLFEVTILGVKLIRVMVDYVEKELENHIDIKVDSGNAGNATDTTDKTEAKKDAEVDEQNEQPNN